MPPTRSARGLATAAALLAAAAASPASAQDPADPSDPRSVAFFEAKIRPILVARCLSCHGPEASKAGLRLDTRAGAIDRGGDSGPPIVPGAPDESLLIEAVRYESFVRMPPSSKLPDTEVDLLAAWVAHGAPWPADHGPDPDAPDPSVPFDLAARSSHWSLRPVAEPPVPDVEHPDWPRNPIDRFVLARLEAAGLEPAPDADRHALIRRASFGLTGLPPTPEEVARFVADDRPDAFERLVDRLLDSPRYGERWARHWLDLVRFAETSGHEFDYDILTAHRYRDYVIRALNDDLPYDRFVVEHLAGDLLDDPRRHPTLGTDESILGTMAYFFAEGTHSPVDVTEEMRTRVDNQIDVLGKAFLGLTIACARCHDHKFDAVSTRDYYALAGHLQGIRHQYALIDHPDRIAGPASRLDALRAALAAEAAPLLPAGHGAAPPPTLREGEDLVEAFGSDGFAGWYPSGLAFGGGPTRPGDVAVSPDGDLIALAPGWAHSGAIAPKLVGVLRSESFTIERPFLHLLASGSGGRINLVVDGFEKIRDPIYGGLTRVVDHGDRARWVTIDASMWLGRPAYLELADGATADYTGVTSAIVPGDGFLAVGLVLRSDHRDPPDLGPSAPDGPTLAVIPRGDLPDAAASLLDRYGELAASLPEPTLALAAAAGTPVDVPVHIRGSTRNLGAVVPRGFLEVLDPDPSARPADRLALARRIADPSNPLTARVLVNRLWAHHLGRGIVASPDDFGTMGAPPTHPELLDWLAAEFVRSGWSIKHMHRMIMTSASYRMSARPRPEAEAVDPDNLLLHRARLRRLEAEAIRDAMLALSGRLDPSLFGPSVPTHLTPFMEGRGRPRRSGPPDGHGRRTLYLDVRRNFLSPLLLAFDFPSPATARGRRDSSNVPAQALALMNDPFVLDQARLWADRLSSGPPRSPESLVESLYLSAFARPPSPAERARAQAFLDSAPLVELCHALLNAKEFLYLD